MSAGLPSQEAPEDRVSVMHSYPLAGHQAQAPAGLSVVPPASHRPPASPPYRAISSPAKLLVRLHSAASNTSLAASGSSGAPRASLDGAASVLSLYDADSALAHSAGEEHHAAIAGGSGGAAPAPDMPALVVFSGGTAFNSVAGPLRAWTTRVTYVLPVSDDGGSTAEIVRVLGGPAVGDIRSRCLRLADASDSEARAVRQLLAHRLAGASAAEAKREWYEIVEGQHPLWAAVSDPYKHTIRAFLVYFHTQIQRHSTERFNFRNGSVGNFFFAGARLFFRSLEAAIFLFSRVARIPEGSLVLPAICTEERITLGAALADGSVIRGQNEISHPSVAESPGPQLVDKQSQGPALRAPVRRIFYLSSEGTHGEHEVYPPPNPRVLSQLDGADAVIYGIGSLYTSICPSLTLPGLGEVIAQRAVPKLFLLNGSHDRETGATASGRGPMSAAAIVQAVCDTLNRLHTRRGAPLAHPPAAYVTTLVAPRGGEIEVDRDALAALGIREVVEVDAMQLPGSSAVRYDAHALVAAIRDIVEAHREAAQLDGSGPLAAADGVAGRLGDMKLEPAPALQGAPG